LRPRGQEVKKVVGKQENQQVWLVHTPAASLLGTIPTTLIVPDNLQHLGHPFTPHSQPSLPPQAAHAHRIPHKQHMHTEYPGIFLHQLPHYHRVARLLTEV